MLTAPPFSLHTHQCPGGKDLAVATFKEHRKQYHNIASTMVAKDLGLA